MFNLNSVHKMSFIVIKSFPPKCKTWQINKSKEINTTGTVFMIINYSSLKYGINSTLIDQNIINYNTLQCYLR